MRVVFILATGRSGSTLLDKAIGSHPECFSLGEITNLPTELAKDTTPCGCGKWLKDCIFWQSILNSDSNSKYFNSIINNSYNITNPHSGILKKLHVILLLLGRIDYTNRQQIKNNIILYNMISSYSHKDILIDSSKEITRSIILGRHIANSFYIHLIRDCGAVLASRKKTSYRVTTPDGTKSYSSYSNESYTDSKMLAQWAQYNRKASLMLKTINRNNKYILQYEEFVDSPESHLSAISNMIGIDYNPNMKILNNISNHMIGGNPSRVNAKSILKPIS